MSSFTIQAQARETRGKEAMKKMRRAGRIPAIIYGVGEPTSVSVDLREFNNMNARIAGEKVLVDLEVNGEVQKVFVREVQIEPVKDTPIHVDFFRADMDKPMHTWVQIHAVGIPEGVRNGSGILEHGTRELEISAKPTDVPPHIEVDVTHLHSGQSLHVSDLPALPGVVIMTSKDAVLFLVQSKAKATAEEPEAEVAAVAAVAPAPAK